MSSSVSAVYLHVVDDVVSKLREEFLNERVDDSVLTVLQGLWEMKMLHCGAVQGPIERNPAPRAAAPTPVHDLNVPYEGPEEYETPTAEMLFPPTPLQTPVQTPLPVDTPAYQYFPSGSSEHAGTPDIGTAADMKHGRPSPYIQQPSPWMNQRPLGVDVNIAYEEAREEEEGGGAGGDGGGNSNGEGVITQVPQPPMTDFFMMTSGKRKREDYASHLLPDGYIPQRDGAGDATVGHSHEKVSVGISSLTKAASRTLLDRLILQGRESADSAIATIKMKQSTIPQYDGFPDVYDDGVSNEDYNTPSYNDPLTAHNVGTPKPTKSEALEDDEPPLNEDDDDDDDLDDLEQGDEEPSTNHLVLAQFEKVTRTKSRWKCILKDGIMHLNKKDILFTKANGEFEF